MGLDYSVHVIASRVQTEAVLRAVSESVASEDRVAVGELSASVRCLAFRFPVDDAALRAFCDDADVETATVGCFYTRLWIGARFVVLEATAATTGMSRLLLDSSSVRQAFVRIAVACGAVAVVVDVEEGTGVAGVWPVETWIAAPPIWPRESGVGCDLYGETVAAILDTIAGTG